MKPITITKLEIFSVVVVMLFVLLEVPMISTAHAQCWACGLSNMGNAMSNFGSSLVQQQMEYDEQKKLLKLQLKQEEQEQKAEQEQQLAASCIAPTPPVISINGATATEQQLNDEIASYDTYQSRENAFQRCIYAESQQMELVDPAILSTLKSRDEAVQGEKQALATQINAQIFAFNQAQSERHRINYDQQEKLKKREQEERQLIDNCTEPTPPALSINGATASINQLNTAIASFDNYEIRSSVFQRCIYAENEKARQISPSILSALKYRSEAVAGQEQATEMEINALIFSFKRAHSKN